MAFRVYMCFDLPLYGERFIKNNTAAFYAPPLGLCLKDLLGVSVQGSLVNMNTHCPSHPVVQRGIQADMANNDAPPTGGRNEAYCRVPGGWAFRMSEVPL